MLFPGEAAGVSLRGAVRRFWVSAAPSTDQVPGTYLYPATPPRLDGAVLKPSINRLLGHGDVRYLCYGHYGWTENPREMLGLAVRQFDLWTAAAPEENENEAVLRLSGILLRKDPLLAPFAGFTREQQGKERYFMENSLRGILRWLGG